MLWNNFFSILQIESDMSRLKKNEESSAGGTKRLVSKRL